MGGRTDEEMASFVSRVMLFVKHYAFDYQLEGPVYLVLDNSLIQDFKHSNDPKRELNAHAYTVFCRSVTGWSDRPRIWHRRELLSMSTWDGGWHRRSRWHTMLSSM
jgi:hypothetical protein